MLAAMPYADITVVPLRLPFLLSGSWCDTVEGPSAFHFVQRKTTSSLLNYPSPKAFWEKLLLKDVYFHLVSQRNQQKKESDLIVYIASKQTSLLFFRFFSDLSLKFWYPLICQVSCSEHVHGSINPNPNPGSCTASGDAAPIVFWFLGKRNEKDGCGKREGDVLFWIRS